MPASSAIRRLAELHPKAEIWWDSSPLILKDWQQDCRKEWADRPELLAALNDLGSFQSLDRVFRGCTTNPPLSLEVVQTHTGTWENWTRSQAGQAESPNELLWQLYGQILLRGARMLAPLWDDSNGRYGHICGQVDPRDLDDTDTMVAQGRRLHDVHRNVMIKMPGTPEGIKGIRVLSSLGISTNATLCFSAAQIVAVAEAAHAGFEQARADGVDMTGARSVATMMLGRMEDAPQFVEEADQLGISLSELDRRWAGVAVARKAYQILQERDYETTLLLASMRMGPTVDGETRIWHLEQLAGGHTVMTIFPNIMAGFIETYAERELEPCIEEPVPAEILDRLLQVPYFQKAYNEDALSPDEFGNLPGVVLTGAGFTESMQALDDFVRKIWEEER